MERDQGGEQVPNPLIKFLLKLHLLNKQIKMEINALSAEYGPCSKYQMSNAQEREIRIPRVIQVSGTGIYRGW